MSPKNRAQDEDQSPEPSADVEAQVYGAMRELGWIVPQTCEAVRRAEARLVSHPIKLPERLNHPLDVLEDAARDLPARPMDQVAQNAEVEQNLARAAREGGKIPPEVEARMRQDRKAAQREARNHESDSSDE